MKRTEIKDLRAKDLKGLTAKVQELRVEMAAILIENSLGKLKDVHKVRAKRKEMAQVLTFAAQNRFESQLKTEKLQLEKEKQK